MAKYLRTLERPSSQEVPALVANLAATREHYKDIARQFILGQDYPREDIDEDHLTLEVELYLFWDNPGICRDAVPQMETFSCNCM